MEYIESLYTNVGIVFVFVILVILIIVFSIANRRKRR